MFRYMLFFIRQYFFCKHIKTNLEFNESLLTAWQGSAIQTSFWGQ